VTNIGAIVPLLKGGIGRWENAVVQRAGFTDQAEPFALGLWDKLDNFTHVRLLNNVPHFLRRPRMEMGRRACVVRLGNRKEPFQIVESPDRVMFQSR